MKRIKEKYSDDCYNYRYSDNDNDDLLTKQLNANREIMKNIMSDRTYFEWLSEFTEKNGGFCDTWLWYIKDDLDKENLKYLGLFYAGIKEYAKKNYIYPDNCNYGYAYRVRLNEELLEVGVIIGHDVEYFCKKMSVEEDSKSIDLDDIISDKKQDNVEIIDSYLSSLANMVKDTYNRGVPIQAISRTLDETVSGIKKGKNNIKKLVK